MNSLQQLKTADVASAIRERISGRWLRAWLFFGVGDGVTGSMLYVERQSSGNIEELLPDDINEALISLHVRSVGLGCEIKSGTAILHADGAVDFEFGYDDLLEHEDVLDEYVENMVEKYFAGRAITRAKLDNVD